MKILIALLPLILIISVGCSNGVSSDENDPSWELLYGLGKVHDLKEFDGVFFAATEILSRSTYQGKSWNPSVDGLPEDGHYGFQPISEFDGVMYAGTKKDGLYQSTDKGLHWEPLSKDLSGLIYAMIQVGNDLFVGMDRGRIYRSSDMGVTWQPAHDTLSSMLITTLESHGQYLFAGTDHNGIFRSSDRGETWHPVNNGLAGDLEAIGHILSYNNTTVFAGTGTNGLYQSTDNGDTWTHVENGLPSENLILGELQYVDGHLYVTLQNYVYESTDGGKNWKSISQGLPYKSGYQYQPVIQAFAHTEHGLYAATWYTNRIQNNFTEYLLWRLSR